MLAKLAIKLSPQKDGFSQALKVFLGARRTWMFFFVEVYYFWTHINFEDYPFSGAILVLGGVFEIFCLFGDSPNSVVTLGVLTVGVKSRGG